jgi:hypothetical protein
VPRGPPWLSCTEGAQTARGGDISLTVNVNGDVKDPDTFATMVVDRAEKKLLPLVQGDAKNGKLDVIIDNRAKQVRR